MIRLEGIGNNLSWTIPCGELHGWGYCPEPPELMSRQYFFWATNSSAVVSGGRAGRRIMVDVWLNDATFNFREPAEIYLNALQGLVGWWGTVIISKPSVNNATEVQSWLEVVFEGFTPTGRSKAPLVNYIPAPVGPAGNFWLPGVLSFIQPYFDPANVINLPVTGAANPNDPGIGGG